MKEFFLNYFTNLPDFDASKLQAIDWTAWFTQPVSPPPHSPFALFFTP